LPQLEAQFCSDHCEMAQKIETPEEPGCGCGHYGCDPKTIKTPTEQEVELPTPAAECV
jgi:hypothetical protein